MNRHTPWLVTGDAIRPAGKPTECFYCQRPLGDLHEPDCVIRERTVVVRAVVEYVILVPEDWTARQIEFHRNEGSWCSTNMLAELESLERHADHLCPFVTYEYVREATEDDEKASGVSVEPPITVIP